MRYKVISSERTADRVAIRDVGEVMPGAEHRAVAGEHDAGRVALPDPAERRDQLAHVRQRPRVRRCGLFIVIVANSPDCFTRMCSYSMVASSLSQQPTTQASMQD